MFMDHKCPYYKYVNFDIQRDSMKSQSKPQQVGFFFFFDHIRFIWKCKGPGIAKPVLKKVRWKTFTTIYQSLL